jgi:hypothetical protein
MPAKSLFSKVSFIIIGERKAKVKGKSEKKAKINTFAVRGKEKKTTEAGKINCRSREGGNLRFSLD